MAVQSQAGYAGDVDPVVAYQDLASNPNAQLIDVRTRAEWSFVGIPDLSALGKEPLLIEWQSWPAMDVAGDFVKRLGEQLAARNVGSEAPLYFICRSGVRSGAAALAAAGAGFSSTFNVTGGFEGPPDGERHRGRIAGWKAASLPWSQS